MPKVSTNITLDPELKRQAQELYADLGLDLSTAVTLFLKQSLRVGGIPFSVRKRPASLRRATGSEVPPEILEDILNEYRYRSEHPEEYPAYSSVEEMTEALDAED